MRWKKKRIGLVLGSGGARGWAHIGVINAIHDLGIEIHCVAGVSMGALVGAAFASGKIDALHHVALDLDWQRIAYYFMEFSLPRTGLIDGTRIVEFVKEHVSPLAIEELPIPFSAVATDVLTGDEVVLNQGSVIDAVRASIAIPGMFTPLVRNNRVLVDGGLVNPLPIGLARQMGADVVIAVDVTRAPLPARHRSKVRSRDVKHTQPYVPTQPDRTEHMHHVLAGLNLKLRSFDSARLSALKKWFTRDDLPNIFEIYGNTMRIIQKQITAMRIELDPPDLLIQPNIQDIRTMDFNRAADAIQAGYEAAWIALENGSLKNAGSTKKSRQ